MKLDEKTLQSLALQLGFGGGELNAKAAMEKANSLSGEKEADLMRQLAALKADMEKDPVQFRRQMASLQKLRSLLDPQQQKKLDQVLGKLGL
ncbi:MAG: hypothetical protein E7223_07060 [Clostridiales bacterium]|nr:hypothetical protein [Clostridiales bacterium]